MEVWKDVPEYVGLYQVSSLGKVQGFAWKQEWKLIKSYYNSQGYLWVKFCKEGKQKGYSIARLVGLTFIPNPDNLPQIDHIDRNKLNNNISNLRWVTRSENCINRVGAGNISGEKNIYYRASKDRYELMIRRTPNVFFKSFRTLQEAVEFRNNYTAEIKI